MSLYISTCGDTNFKNIAIVSALRSLENISGKLVLTAMKSQIIFESELLATAIKYVSSNFIADVHYPLVMYNELRPGTVSLDMRGQKLHLLCMVAESGWFYNYNVEYDLGYFEIVECDYPEDPTVEQLRKYLNDESSRNEELRLLVAMRRLDLISAQNKINGLIDEVDILKDKFDVELKNTAALKAEISELTSINWHLKMATESRGFTNLIGTPTNNTAVTSASVNTSWPRPITNKYGITNSQLSVGDLAAEIKLFNKSSLRDSRIK